MKNYYNYLCLYAYDYSKVSQRDEGNTLLNNKQIYQHGPYAFKLSTEKITNNILNKRIIDAIEGQFRSFNTTTDNTKTAIEFYFVEDISIYFQYHHYIHIGSVQYAENSIKFLNDEIAFVYTKNEGVHKLYIQIVNNRSLKANCRLLNKAFTDTVQNQISVFYYRVFLIFTQLINIDYNTTYIHGTSIADNENNAILFPAYSGVGKSSMLFKLANEGHYSYIADDLSIIDNNFNTYYIGRAISTKPYHIKNFPFLSKIIKERMPKLQQLQWKILNDNRLVYRMSPNDLFLDKIVKKAIITKVIHLVNTNDKEFTLQPIDALTMAKASANILMNELFLGYFNIYKALSIPSNELLLSPAIVYSKTVEQYVKLFKNVEMHLLLVPYMSHPEKMYDFLLSHDILK